MIKKLQVINIKDIELTNQQTYTDFQKKGFQPRNDLPPYKMALPLDWSIDPYGDSNWTFQLHSWRNLDPALKDYKINKKESTLLFIMDVIKSWFYFSEEKQHDFLWYDMAVGLRAQKIGLLATELLDLAERDNKNKKWVYPLILSHLEILLDSTKFSLNNHGIFQVHGLMVLAKAFDFSNLRSNKQISDIALERMSRLWNNQFYPEGIHSENSPEYHIFAHRKFVKLAASNWYTSIRLDDALISAKRNFFWLCRPNKQLWPIGDSNASVLNITDDIVEREFLLSPEHKNINFKFFEQSGYFISKSRDSKFGLFISTARKNKIHMHNDDLNFEWFDFGRPIIVDSGKYGYTGCKYRSYHKSQKAHNITLINGKPIHGDLYESCLSQIVKKNYGLLIELDLQSSDKNTNNKRIIIVKKGAFLIVIDRIKSHSEVLIEQQFHLHPDFDVYQKSNNYHEHTFIDNKDNFEIRVQTISQNNIDKTVNYGDGVNEYSFVSESYKKHSPSHLIKNKSTSSHAVIANLFTTSDYNINMENNAIQINKGNMLIDLIDIDI